MPRELVTDWKCIGQSGFTVDGREIKSEWLTEMAETYDPDVYTALIWWEHYRFLGNYGQVKQLKSISEEDVTKLYAIISPNTKLIDLNEDDQKLFSSMEVTANFAQSGKYYLTGMACTDEPASLGTDQLKFSKSGYNQDSLFAKPVPIQFNVNPSAEATLIQKVGDFFGLTPKNQPQESADMTPEQFSTLEQLFKTQNEAIQGLGAQLQSFSQTQTAPETAVETTTDTQAPAQSLETKFDDMTKAFNQFSKQLTDALGEQTVTETPEHTGSAPQQKCL